MSTLNTRQAGLAETTVTAAAPPGTAATQNPAQVRILTFIVVVLGILLLLGLAAVVGRIIYLGSQRTPSAAQTSVEAPRLSLAVPAGASVKHTAIAGDRLSITYETPQRTGIVVVNLATGQIISRIDLVTEVPR
jgi:hypothetical protein